MTIVVMYIGCWISALARHRTLRRRERQTMLPEARIIR